MKGRRRSPSRKDLKTGRVRNTRLIPLRRIRLGLALCLVNVKNTSQTIQVKRRRASPWKMISPMMNTIIPCLILVNVDALKIRMKIQLSQNTTRQQKSTCKSICLPVNPKKLRQSSGNRNQWKGDQDKRMKKFIGTVLMCHLRKY